MRKLAFRYRRVKEIYNTYKNNVGGEPGSHFIVHCCVQRYSDQQGSVSFEVLIRVTCDGIEPIR